MTAVGVFLHDAQRKRIIPSSRPVPMSVEVATAEFCGLPRVAGNFIGFVRADGTILQLAWNERQDLVEVDVPLPSLRGSLSGQVTSDEARTLIGSFAAGLPLEDILSVRFKRWAPS